MRRLKEKLKKKMTIVSSMSRRKMRRKRETFRKEKLSKKGFKNVLILLNRHKDLKGSWQTDLKLTKRKKKCI